MLNIFAHSFLTATRQDQPVQEPRAEEKPKLRVPRQSCCAFDSARGMVKIRQL